MSSGFTDADGWVDGLGPDDPRPFDDACQRKPAFYDLHDGLWGPWSLHIEINRRG